MLGGFGCLFAVDGGGGADGGLAKGHSLALIVDVRMGCHHILALIQVLKDHHGLTGQGGGIKGVGQFHCALGAGGGKLHLCGDLGLFLALAHQQGFTCLLVHEHTGNLIGFAHLQVLVLHGVGNGDFPGRSSSVFPVHQGRGADFGHAFKLVIQGAQVNGGVVPGDGDVLHPHQVVALVAGAAQLLYRVGVVGESAEAILGLHHPALGGQPKPSAVVVIPLGLIGNPVVAVGVLAVGVPFCFGADLAVFVRHHDVGFPCGFRDELKGHIGETGHVALAALAHFHKLQVATDDLVIGSIAVPILYHLAILPDGKVSHGLVGMQVALTRLYLLHFIGAVRQRTVFGLGDSVFDLDGSAHFAGVIESAVDVHSVLGLVGDFKESAVQACTAQRREQAGFQVAFFDEDISTDHLVGAGELIDDSIVLDENGLVRHCVQHRFIGGRLVQNVFAVGEEVIRSAGLALAIRHQGLDHLAGLIFLALYHHGISGIVDNLEGDTLKIGVALGRGAGDGIRLLQGQAATLHIVHGGNCHGMAVLPHGDGFAGPGEQHTLVGSRLLHLISAVGESIVAGAGDSRFVGGDGHNHLAHGIGGAVHHHGVG